LSSSCFKGAGDDRYVGCSAAIHSETGVLFRTFQLAVIFCLQVRHASLTRSALPSQGFCYCQRIDYLLLLSCNHKPNNQMFISGNCSGVVQGQEVGKNELDQQLNVSSSTEICFVQKIHRSILYSFKSY